MNKSNIYWTKEQEDAIVDYINTEDQELRHKIYENHLHESFKKLIENIYYTFHFYTTLPDFDNQQEDLLSYILERIEKFQPSYNKKAFSYFGTVVKNWLIQKSTKSKKFVHINEIEKELLISDESEKRFKDVENSNYNVKVVNCIVLELEKQKNGNLAFNDDDKAITDIILYILNNTNKFDIYNKKQLYVYLKEATGLPARKITKTLVILKQVYHNVKKDLND
jgi:hypothetical protein